MYPKALLQLINYFKKLPGVGSKTAERFAFEMIEFEENELTDFGLLLKDLKKNILKCKTCSCLIESDYCSFCDDTKRDTNKLCIVSSFKDVLQLESTKSFNGLYHIIEHLISPVDGKDIDSLNIETIKKRILQFNIKEVIIALDSTLEGDATSLYLKDELKNYDTIISRLAFGLPMGTSLDFIDKTTLMQAFVDRKSFQQS